MQIIPTIIFLLLIGGYIVYELYGSKLKTIYKSSLHWVRIAAVAVGGVILLYLYYSNSSLFYSIIETIAPEPVQRVMVLAGSNTSKPDLSDLPTETTRIQRSVSGAKKKRVAAKQQWKCAICNNILDETYEVDHILALSNGGTNEDDNLRALCRPCHAKKTFEERS